ncbi:acetyl-CoA hydrolase/transferase C-terminal domain-containing protein [Dactylosporangium sp. AC04546]|uniref:acetyl-CoA hydrolase/transferase family protein n=1 Tax=Dactylosporangium sp. AC04546 TaxID=2862460 RepID=UPI001EDD752A|nr:acetyl-CoA hydrolase/transferase C-terminal domain-containing protein [Dactylosporangium sp. AC04546]WVK78540.1 acetyl-CoA hydrolase/transferase C-terminal domain-containing protein [Dactylosporangium sp. AC04546]
MTRTVTEPQLARVLGALPGTPRIVASGNFAAPRRLLAVADAAVAEFRLFMLNAQPGIPDRDGVGYETPFVGPGMRGHPRLRYFPCRLSLVPALLRQRLRPDVVLLHTARPSGGTVSLGVEVNVLPAAVEAVRARGGIVVAQANAAMPVTYGDAQLPLDAVDYLLEADEPLAAHAAAAPDATSAAIGDRVAALIPAAATLQLGIGAIPDATLGALLDRRGLRIWSEMFSDGALTLEKAGCLERDTPVTASFCFGSAELYDWVDRNPRVRMLRTEKTNDPAAIAAQPALFSVNSALQVDLFAQANASRVGTRTHSGFGGQTDFIVGAMHSPGGHAIIALRSWHPKADVSAVVPLLTGPVTSFQHSYIVTEQGTARIWGRDSVEQAQEILGHAAHPDARPGLRDAGRGLGLPLR